MIIIKNKLFYDYVLYLFYILYVYIKNIVKHKTIEIIIANIIEN